MGLTQSANTVLFHRASTSVGSAKSANAVVLNLGDISPPPVGDRAAQGVKIMAGAIGGDKNIDASMCPTFENSVRPEFGR